MRSRSIAMRCTQEQFNKIKPKLEIEGFKFDYINCFKRNPYLVNYCHHKYNISNCTVFYKENYSEKHESYETWNEQIFLEACGIEAEKLLNKKIV